MSRPRADHRPHPPPIRHNSLTEYQFSPVICIRGHRTLSRSTGEDTPGAHVYSMSGPTPVVTGLQGRVQEFGAEADPLTFEQPVRLDADGK